MTYYEKVAYLEKLSSETGFSFDDIEEIEYNPAKRTNSKIRINAIIGMGCESPKETTK